MEQHEHDVRPSVYFWPGYSRSNPYTDLLYSAARSTYDIGAGTIRDALSALSAPGPKRPRVIFHLHWLNEITANAKTRDAAEQSFADFLNDLALFRERGGRVVWTIHNTLSHDGRFRDLELEMSPIITARSDVLHFHARSSVPEVLQVFPFPVERAVISAHGNYAGVYRDNGLSQNDARAALGIDPGDDVILSIGFVRPYKGTELLLEAFRTVMRDRPRLRLIVAGRVHGGVLPDIVPPLTRSEMERITVTNSFVEPERLQYYLRAADIGIYPYRSILTSGSLLLALTFGLPAILPGVGMVREVLDGYDAGITFPHGAGTGPVSSAIAALFARKDEGTLGQMSENARKRAAQLVWPDFTPILDKALG